MAGVFAKLAPGIRRHPKCREAGRDGTDVFIHALCVNADRGALGTVPAIFMRARFLQDELLFDSEEQAAEGLRRAVAAGLLEMLADGAFMITGWDEEEWGRARGSHSMTEAERKAAQRASNREQKRVAASMSGHVSGQSRQVSGRLDYAESDAESDQDAEGEGTGPASPPPPALRLKVQEPKPKPIAKPKRVKAPPPADPADNPQPTAADRAYAAARQVDVAAEWPAMFDSYRRRAELSADWSASWRTWCRNAVKFREERGGRAGPAPPRPGTIRPRPML